MAFALGATCFARGVLRVRGVAVCDVDIANVSVGYMLRAIVKVCMLVA